MDMLLKNAYFSFKALFAWIEPKNYILMKVVTPLLHLSFFVLVAKNSSNNNIDEFIIGNTFLLTVYNAVYSLGRVLAEERNFGTLKLLTIVPSNKLSIYIGRGLIHIVDSYIGVLFGIVYSYFLFDFSIEFEKFFGFSVILIVSIFSIIGFGLLLGIFGLLVVDMSLILNTAVIFLLTFTGANVPLEKLPTVFQKLSNALPLTNGIKACQLFIINNLNFSGIKIFLFRELTIGIFYYIVGYFIYRTIEMKSRQCDTLELN